MVSSISNSSAFTDATRVMSPPARADIWRSSSRSSALGANGSLPPGTSAVIAASGRTAEVRTSSSSNDAWAMSGDTVSSGGSGGG